MHVSKNGGLLDDTLHLCKQIYSTAKETQKFDSFKMFEYLICSIPEF